jgi:hypothetical protein
MATKTEISEPGPVAATVTVEVRGQRYEFRELEIGTYDKLLKQATREEADADGIMQEVTDNTLLLRLMVLKSCVSPKLTAESVNELGTRLYRSLARVVNELHYAEEPVKQISDDPAPVAEETPKGND